MDSSLIGIKCIGFEGDLEKLPAKTRET